MSLDVNLILNPLQAPSKNDKLIVPQSKRCSSHYLYSVFTTRRKIFTLGLLLTVRHREEKILELKPIMINFRGGCGFFVSQPVPTTITV